MSNKRYRSRPGQPRNETEAMIRAMAMELLDGALLELNQEIAILKDTVELYHHELRKRRNEPDKEWGRWQIAPGVAMRAQSMLRRLRDRRDKMLAETEAEVVEMAMGEPPAATDAQKQAAPDVDGQATKPTAKSEADSYTLRRQPAEGKFAWHTAAQAMAKLESPNEKRKQESAPEYEPSETAA